MKAFFAPAVATAALTFVAATTVSVAAETEPWTYKAHEAEHYAPPQWFRQYPDCGGQRQSPIDISVTSKSTSKHHTPATRPIQLSGACPNYNIKQYWESFKAETAPTAATTNGTSASPTACSLAVNGKAYAFAQVHFHAPSEHTIHGKHYDGETHFVHKATDGTIAVVGLFIQKSKHVAVGQSDPFFCNFLQALKRVNETHPVAAALGEYATALKTNLAKGAVFNYPGSLTTPACSQVVDWWVVETPLEVSESEFHEIHHELTRIGAADDGKNARPTQPLNGRTVSVY